MRQIQHLNPLVDTNQSWWELVAIQFSGWMGIPVLASSLFILQQNSFLGAVLTIIVGNAIMWFIRLGIILMSQENRQSTLDLSKTYLGHFGGYFISILLLVSTFAWYITQTMIGGNNISHLLAISENPAINQFAQVSVLLGILSAFLCMEGIVLLRKLSIISFPILVIAFLVILFSAPIQITKTSTQSLSLSGLSLFLATNLGLSSDLPTFFRHGQSWRQSIKALTFIQLIAIVFGIFSLFLGALVVDDLAINEQVALSGSDWLRYALVVFIFFSVICANVANVYSASVGWEIVAPRALVGRKEYLIMGLSLTILFILISDLVPVESLLKFSCYFLVNLCLVLVLGFIISNRQKKPPSPYLQVTYFLAWALSSIANIIQSFYKAMQSQIVVSFLVIILVILASFLNQSIKTRKST